MFFQRDRMESFIKVRSTVGGGLNRREWRKQRAQEDHPKHASLIRRIENQYRLSASLSPFPVLPHAVGTANEMRDVHQNGIYTPCRIKNSARFARLTRCGNRVTLLRITVIL